MEGKREALIRHALNPIGTQVHESQTSAVTLQAAPGVDLGPIDDLSTDTAPENRENRTSDPARVYSIQAESNDTLPSLPDYLRDAKEINSSVDDFFSDDSGRTFLPPTLLDGIHLHTLTLTQTSVSLDSTISKTPTEISAATVVSAGHHRKLSLQELCQVIDEHHSMQQAEILAAEGYKEWTGTVMHRFLVLELHRFNRKPIWLRVDRRRARDVSAFRFLAARGTTPANDTAELAPDKESLIYRSQLENRQTFRTVPTLGELRHVFRVISIALRRYQLWPANCWFFVSLLQQHLGAAGDGAFPYGEIPNPTLAQDIRQEINARLHLIYHFTELPTLKQMLLYLRSAYPYVADISTALDLLDLWNRLANARPPKSQASESANRLRSLLISLLEQVSSSSKEDACAFARLIVQFTSDAHQHAPDVGRSFAVTSALRALASTLHSANRTYDIVPIYRTLNSMDPNKYRDEFIASLHALGDAQHANGRTSDELRTRLGCLCTCCDMYDTHRTYEWRKHAMQSVEKLEGFIKHLNSPEATRAHPGRLVMDHCGLWKGNSIEFRRGIVKCLWQLADFLRMGSHMSGALTAGQQAVTLCRSLAKEDLEAFHKDLADSLWKLADLQHKIGHAEEASSLGKEVVLIYRRLANQSPHTFQRNLVDSLWALADIHRALGRPVDAAATHQEAVSICHGVAEQDPQTHSTDLIDSLWERANTLRDVNRAEEASNVGREVVDIYLKLRRKAPEACRKELVASQWRLAELLRALGRSEDASIAETQMLETYRNIWGALSPESHQRRVASIRVLAQVTESGESLLEQAPSDTFIQQTPETGPAILFPTKNPETGKRETPDPDLGSQSRGTLRDSAPEASSSIGEAQKQPSITDIDNLIGRLLEVGYSGKVSKTVCLTNSEVTAVCSTARQVFLSQPTLLELSPPVKIVGDVHGQYSDLIRLFGMCGFPPTSNYLFLGDYVDYGKQSIETILLLLCYKIRYPENFFMLRGHHECANITRVHDFYDECKRRSNIKIWKLFIDVFNCLPIASIVASKIFCVHGGLSPSLQALEDIKRIVRPTDIPDFGLLNDLLWSDPSDTAVDWEDNERGLSYCFGRSVVNEFLRRYDLDLVCRAHMVVEDGYEFWNDRTLVTLFSAPNYQGEYDNYGACMIVTEDLLCTFELLKPLGAQALRNDLARLKKARQQEDDKSN